MIPALVVGCGAIGSDYDRQAKPGSAPRSHAGAYATSPRTALVGGVDPDPEARRRFSERWDAPCYASIAEAWEASPSRVASVSSPPEGRAAIVAELLEHGVEAIWIEKPLAESVAAGERIVAACASAGVPLQVNFLRRFDPLHRRVADAVRGRVLHADFRFSGTLESSGSHAIDLFRWFAGEPVEVSSDGEIVRLATADGRRGTLARVTGTALPLFDCDLWLDDGRIALAAFGEQLLVAREADSTLFPALRRCEFGAPDPELGLQYAMAAGLDALLERLEHGTPLPCDGADGVAELRIREAAAR